MENGGIVFRFPTVTKDICVFYTASSQALRFTVRAIQWGLRALYLVEN